MKNRLVVAGLWVFLSVLQTFAAPDQLSYQGKLLQGTNLVNETATFQFRLYSAASGGVLYYSQTQSVSVVDGLYSTTIGDNTVVPPLAEVLAHPAIFIEVEINGTVLSPREPLLQTAYAMTAVRRDGDCMSGPLGIDADASGDLIITNSGDSVRLGGSTSGEIAAVAVGYGSSAEEHGVAVGFLANGMSYGVGVGYDTKGMENGAALGSQANARDLGTAIGFSSDGHSNGVAVGAYADGFDYGAAVGVDANARNFGSALGFGAAGVNSNIAIGQGARAVAGSKRIAIGTQTTNEIDHSAVLRGTLYLDGGTGVYYRSTFGSGGWSALGGGGSATGFVQKSGDTMSGLLSITNSLRVFTEQNRVSTVRPMLILNGGSDVEIGNEANGYFFGAGVGYQANGYSYAAAVGYQANATDSGAAIGYGANAMRQGVAVGWSAAGTNFGVAVGGDARGSDFGTALGNSANAVQYGASVGHYASGRNNGTAVGYNSGGSDYGVGVGKGAQGATYGVAVGMGSSGGASGTAVGVSAAGYNGGLAIGAQANGTWGNMAVGQQAHAGSGFNRTAVGPQVTNVADNSVALRGTLYLDGATGILFRTTFGAGGWSNMLANFTESDPRWTAASNDMQSQINVRLASNAWASAQSTTNTVRRTGDTMTGALTISNTLSLNYGAEKELIIGSLGTNIAIGQGANSWLEGVAVGYQANGYSFGVAAGTLANAYWYGTAVGYSSTAREYSVSMGHSSRSMYNGVAIGYTANGQDYGAAVGAGANASDRGAALGYGAVGRSYSVAIGYDADAARTNIAIGANASAQLGTERIALGHNVTNSVDNSTALRGTLYLDGGTGIMTRATIGTGNWTNYPRWTWVTAITNIVLQKQTISPYSVTNVITQTGQLKVLQ